MFIGACRTKFNLRNNYYFSPDVDELDQILTVTSRDDVTGCSTSVSMQSLDLGSIFIAYIQVQHIRHHETPLDTNS